MGYIAVLYYIIYILKLGVLSFSLYYIFTSYDGKITDVKCENINNYKIISIKVLLIIYLILLITHLILTGVIKYIKI